VTEIGLLLSLGILLYVGLWLSHDSGGIPGRGQGPKWTTAPNALRRIFRHDSGPVLLVSALIQGVALLIVLRSVALLGGLHANTIETAMTTVVAAAIVVTAATIFVVYLRARLT